MEFIQGWLQAIDLSKQSVKFNTRVKENKRITSKGSTMGGIITVILVSIILISSFRRITMMYRGELDTFDEKLQPSYSKYPLWNKIKQQKIKVF